jgi:hypothetical protein
VSSSQLLESDKTLVEDVESSSTAQTDVDLIPLGLEA